MAGTCWVNWIGTWQITASSGQRENLQETNTSKRFQRKKTTVSCQFPLNKSILKSCALTDMWTDSNIFRRTNMIICFNKTILIYSWYFLIHCFHRFSTPVSVCSLTRFNAEFQTGKPPCFRGFAPGLLETTEAFYIAIPCQTNQDTRRFLQKEVSWVPVINWLVVWNIFYFPIYWECHHPNWLIIKPPTSHDKPSTLGVPPFPETIELWLPLFCQSPGWDCSWTCAASVTPMQRKCRHGPWSWVVSQEYGIH